MEFESRPSPLFENVVDLLLYVGSEYNVPQYIAETADQGVSKRIALKSIPPNVVPGRTNVYLWHAQVIPIVQAVGRTTVDLVAELQSKGVLATDLDPEDFDWDPADWLLPDDFVPPGILQVTCAIQSDQALRREMEEKYMLRWHGAVFLSSPMGKLRYILKKGETELPEHLKPYAHLIDAVRVVRVDDDGVPLDDQDEACDLDDGGEE